MLKGELTATEERVLKKISLAWPNMSERDKGYMLCMVEKAASESEKEADANKELVCR